MSMNNIVELACGATAYFDETGWRCTNCMMIAGSMGMPSHCKKRMEQQHVIAVLGDKNWSGTIEPMV